MQNENIDIRMSNYLNILAHQELRNALVPEVISLMEQAVSIYATTTSKEYVDEFKRKQASNITEETMGMFK